VARRLPLIRKPRCGAGTVKLTGLADVLSRWLLFVALVATVAACATNPVPGGGTYGIAVYSLNPLGGDWRTNVYNYAGRERSFGLGKSVMSGLTDFHVLNIRWISTSGIERHEVIDIAPLVEQMQVEHEIDILSGLKTLLVEVDGERLRVSYEIIPFRAYVPKKGARHKHLLYESTQN
jgi:hypothetical protein